VKNHFIISSVLLAVAYQLAGCVGQPVEENPIDSPPPTQEEYSEVETPPQPALLTVGDVEQVSIMPEGLGLQAAINTSTELSMLGVSEQAMFSQQGKRWVRFVVKDPVTKKGIQFKRPLSRISRVTRFSGKPQDKLVVSLQIKMGELDLEREFILVDGKYFDYPIIIGKNYLIDKALVDVRQQFLLTDAD